ncbi:ACBP4, partial [Symbiodinium necroappetens]
DSARYCGTRQADRPVWTTPVVTGTKPSSRWRHSAVLDSSGKMWIFGGLHGYYLDDVHCLDTQADPPAWTTPAVTGTKPSFRYGHSAVLDASGKMWIFGGFVGYRSYLDDVHCLDTQAADPPAWTTPAVAGTKWCRAQRNLMGTVRLNMSVMEADPPAWTTPAVTGTKPSSRKGHSAVLDVSGKMWIFAGTNGSHSDFDDVHCLDTQADPPAWTTPAVTGSKPSFRFGHSAVLDASGTMWIFGGLHGAALSGSYLDDVHCLDTQADPPAWTTPAVTGTKPSSRSSLDQQHIHIHINCNRQQHNEYRRFASPVNATAGTEQGTEHRWRSMCFCCPGADYRETQGHSWMRVHELQAYLATNSATDTRARTTASTSHSTSSSFGGEDEPGLSSAVVATLSILIVTLLSAVLVGIAVCKRRAKSSLAKSGERLMPQASLIAAASLELGISALYLQATFPEEARAATGRRVRHREGKIYGFDTWSGGMADPNFYEICNVLAIGSSGKGFGKVCPRDSRVNCSIVDALDAPAQGRATHFVSWCWRYRLEVVVDYRILEEGSMSGSAELQTIFESHLASAGKMLVILDTFLEPLYYSRAWCLFETYVCIEQGFPRDILLPSRELEAFKDMMRNGEAEPMRRKIRQIDLRRAEATVKADEDRIKLMIFTSCGFDAVNRVVQTEIQKWILNAFAMYMSD